MPGTLIDPLELATRLDDPSWAIIDCRFELARPAWGATAFTAGHIPNAQYADLDGDLSGARGAHTGRHPLPEVNELASLFGRLGIDAQVQVVAYDQGNGMYARACGGCCAGSGTPGSRSSTAVSRRGSARDCR
jgi:thiosulfate/3-mercaptopyruvate sulfurtransferase